MNRLPLLTLFLALLLVSCARQETTLPYQDLSLESLTEFRSPANAVSPRNLRRFIDSLRLAETDTNYVDLLCNRYYAERRPYLWVNPSGIDQRLDTLLRYLDNAETIGLPTKLFYTQRIHQSAERIRSCTFTASETASKSFAQLEYYATKAYLRYTKGLRYGFVSPEKLYNTLEKDSDKAPFKILFDIPVERFDAGYAENAIQAIAHHKVEPFIQQSQSTDDHYTTLCNILNQPDLSKTQRHIVAANIERARWRTKATPLPDHINVNLPAQSLTAHNAKGDTLAMKVCCGSRRHKTPQLVSKITHLELNPYWVVPKNIVRQDILPHVGDANYFDRQHFEIIDKASGEVISPELLDASDLMSADYLIRQQKGKENSLGTLIFRFDNSFAVYLHDTNRPSAFRQANRAISHGCIRVERPVDLAMLYFRDKAQDEDYIDSFRLSIDLPPLTQRGRTLKESDNFEPFTRHDFNPPISVSLVYNTCTVSPEGKPMFHPDIYGYDELLLRQLAIK